MCRLTIRTDYKNTRNFSSTSKWSSDLILKHALAEESGEVKRIERYICLPLKDNTNPRDDWKLVTCPICGKSCWESDIARKVLKNKNVAGVCTVCALKTTTDLGGLRYSN